MESRGGDGGQEQDVAAPPGTPSDPPRVADGVELIGAQEGSGFKDPPSLARRADGQVVQLTPLLYRVAERADGQHDFEAIAREVSGEIGRTVTADNVRTLVDQKLRPLGILANPDGSQAHPDKPDPLLALKFRAAIVPERASRALGTVFRPLFFPPVIVAVLVGVVATDYYVFAVHGVAQAIRSALYSPGVFLLLLAGVVLSAAFHETGHATGCRYGGADPGRMGCGLYLAWPAFYTDVTDAYRLGKGGRLRTDLGGVYFNSVFILATMGVYLATHFEPLIILIFLEHIEIVHQLLPIVRLDGYYIVADLTGVPDLFARIGPILRSIIPGRPSDPRVQVLKRWVRLAVTAWVFIVVPALCLQFLLILLHLPAIVGTAYDSFMKQAHSASTSFGQGHWLGGVGAAFEIIALALPMIGIVLMLGRLARRGARLGWERTAGKPGARFAVVTVEVALVALLIYAWVPKGNYAPIRRNQRGTITEEAASFNPLSLTRAKGVAPFTTPQEQSSPGGEIGPSGLPNSSPSPGIGQSPGSGTQTTQGSSAPGSGGATGSGTQTTLPAAVSGLTSSPLRGTSPSPGASGATGPYRTPSPSPRPSASVSRGAPSPASSSLASPTPGP